MNDTSKNTSWGKYAKMGTAALATGAGLVAIGSSIARKRALSANTKYYHVLMLTAALLVADDMLMNVNTPSILIVSKNISHRFAAALLMLIKSPNIRDGQFELASHLLQSSITHAESKDILVLLSTDEGLRKRAGAHWTADDDSTFGIVQLFVQAISKKGMAVATLREGSGGLLQLTLSSLSIPPFQNM